jgi:hypothetical protein
MLPFLHHPVQRHTYVGPSQHFALSLPSTDSHMIPQTVHYSATQGHGQHNAAVPSCNRTPRTLGCVFRCSLHLTGRLPPVTGSGTNTNCFRCASYARATISAEHLRARATSANQSHAAARCQITCVSVQRQLVSQSHAAARCQDSRNHRPILSVIGIVDHARCLLFQGTSNKTGD